MKAYLLSTSCRGIRVVMCGMEHKFKYHVAPKMSRCTAKKAQAQVYKVLTTPNRVQSLTNCATHCDEELVLHDTHGQSMLKH